MNLRKQKLLYLYIRPIDKIYYFHEYHWTNLNIWGPNFIFIAKILKFLITIHKIKKIIKF